MCTDSRLSGTTRLHVYRHLLERKQTCTCVQIPASANASVPARGSAYMEFQGTSPHTCIVRSYPETSRRFETQSVKFLMDMTLV
jgi:hypothetical protein